MFSEKSAYKKGNLTQKVLYSIKFPLLIIGYLEICRIFASRTKAFFAYCKIQKRAEIHSFPYCYLLLYRKMPNFLIFNLSPILSELNTNNLDDMIKKVLYKVLVFCLAFGLGMGLNKLISYVINQTLISYEYSPNSDEILALDRKCLTRGLYKDYCNIDKFYFFTDYPTNCEMLLDYIICANRYKTLEVASDIHKMLVPQFVEGAMPQYKVNQFDKRIMDASYMLNDFCCDYLYRAAKNNDYYAISYIAHLVDGGYSFYDEKIDSFARKYQDIEQLKEAFNAKVINENKMSNHK